MVPDCETVLRNEQVEEGRCSVRDVCPEGAEHGFFRITAYAESCWPAAIGSPLAARVLTMQRNWIGRSILWRWTSAADRCPTSGDPVFTTARTRFRPTS